MSKNIVFLYKLDINRVNYYTLLIFAHAKSPVFVLSHLLTMCKLRHCDGHQSGCLCAKTEIA